MTETGTRARGKATVEQKTGPHTLSSQAAVERKGQMNVPSSASPPIVPAPPGTPAESRRARTARVRRAFNAFDSNGDGKLTHIELAEALASQGIESTNEQAMRILRAYDNRPQDGVMDFEEFKHLVSDVEAGGI